ncbi:MAG TPA: STM4012 family radical SAM protein [Actinospica sp.]|nr:STM4012 family radical SAM protein [Actinospica sp.]
MRPYESYVYAYPHKTAYRPLESRPTLADVWRAEKDRSALSFYAHIPFCEVRCGFCNLFTRVGAPEQLTTRYLDALERQARQVHAALEESGEAPTFANAAIGGGTPTFLDAAELSRLFDLVEKVMRVELGAVPLSVEASPSTATPDRLKVLAERGTTRLSLGVQSFDETESRAAVRPQKAAEVERALDAVRETDIPILNVDLIYGIEGQTEDSWLRSLDTALRWRPEEIYLYPLYVRPLTGLARIGRDADREWDEQRLALYRVGRDHLVAQGYAQTSMRMFRSIGAPRVEGGEDYACQTDGMIGLGCGARSYTSSLHYSFDYAVSAHEVRGIIDDYVTTEDFAHAEVGYLLDQGEQRRRHFLQSLLQADGVDEAAYVERFRTSAREDFAAEIGQLRDAGFIADSSSLRLTPEGLAWSDGIGPLLFSDHVRAAMRAYELK